MKPNVLNKGDYLNQTTYLGWEIKPTDPNQGQ